MNLRIIFSNILLCVGAIHLVAVPHECYSTSLWLASLFAGKLIGVICLVAYSRMRQPYRHEATITKNKPTYGNQNKI